MTISDAGRRGASSATLLLSFVLVVVATGVAAIRFTNLGDLSSTRKISEALLWGLAVILLGSIFIKCVGLIFASGTEVAADSGEMMSAGGGSVGSEGLAGYESEVPEMAVPELDGVKGRPPEELASALRNLSNSDKT